MTRCTSSVPSDPFCFIPEHFCCPADPQHLHAAGAVPQIRSPSSSSLWFPRLGFPTGEARYRLPEDLPLLVTGCGLSAVLVTREDTQPVPNLAFLSGISACLVFEISASGTQGGVCELPRVPRGCYK